jgi:hypothetical protein
VKLHRSVDKTTENTLSTKSFFGHRSHLLKPLSLSALLSIPVLLWLVNSSQTSNGLGNVSTPKDASVSAIVPSATPSNIPSSSVSDNSSNSDSDSVSGSNQVTSGSSTSTTNVKTTNTSSAGGSSATLTVNGQPVALPANGTYTSNSTQDGQQNDISVTNNSDTNSSSTNVTINTDSTTSSSDSQ